MAKKKKGKRYSDNEKKEILSFIESHGRGGLSKAVKKFKVTAATIASWKKAGSWTSSGQKVEPSEELQALREMTKLLMKIEATKEKLAALQERYDAIRKGM